MSRYEYTRDREYIKQWIIDKGFKNSADFAKSVGIARQNLCGFMSGVFNPDIHSLIKMATIAKCDLEEVTELFYTDEIKKLKEERRQTICATTQTIQEKN